MSDAFYPIRQAFNEKLHHINLNAEMPNIQMLDKFAS